jgi:son of sevenless-like protein
VIRVRTINVIKKWLEVQYSDFEDTRMNQLFEGFLQKLTSAGGTEAVWAENVRNFKASLVEERTKPFCHATPPPKPLLPTNLIPRLIRFLDLHPVEIARQLTRIDFASFEKIQPKEYFHKAWMKGSKSKSPNVLAIVENFNKMTYWVASEIVLAKEDKRLLTITRFIELLEHMKEIQNYHGVMVVYSALNLGCVQTFEQTWKEVSGKHMATIKQIETLMDPSGNYKRYRETIKSSGTPLLPFQGVFLTDFTFVDEIPDRLENGMVNFEKMHIIANIFNQLVRFQKHPYNFEEVPYFTEFWKRTVVLSEAELYNAAKKMSLRHSADKEGTQSDDDKLQSKKSKQKSIHSLIQLSKMRKQTI